jgi:glycosyltransferase involved in cell wall biosynthesis
MSISCLAVMCVHNEAPHMERALRDFTEQGIEVVVIDHGCTDGTVDICRRFLGRGLLRIESLPFSGVYDQTGQLEAKAAVIASAPHRWVIHADADEWMHTSRAGETLLQGIARLDRAGHTVINFEEFVFLPAPGDPVPADCKRAMLGYYFFAPQPHRLMRAWRRDAGLTNVSTGGHMLGGGHVDIATEQFVLRHYIVLSQQHAIDKYATRRFSQRDLDRGWHGNRLNLSPERLALPQPSQLKRLPRWDSVELDRSDPLRYHYWDWEKAA